MTTRTLAGVRKSITSSVMWLAQSPIVNTAYSFSIPSPPNILATREMKVDLTYSAKDLPLAYAF
jgi:hypothetical protein